MREAFTVESATKHILESNNIDPSENLTDWMIETVTKSYDCGWCTAFQWVLPDGTSLFYDTHERNWRIDPDAATYFSRWDHAKELLERFGLAEDK